MRVFSKVLLSIFIFSFCAFFCYALDFSANVVSQAKGTPKMTGKIFVKGQKTRMEIAGSISITRLDKGIVWVLMPAQKMYMERPLSPQSAAVTADSNEAKSVLIGTETIDGKGVEKYKIDTVSSGQAVSFYHWLMKGSKIPVKVAAVDNSWFQEYKNIVTVSPDDSLFEIPQGYKKFAMPSMPGMPKTK